MNLESIRKRMGWRPDKPDQRDHVFSLPMFGLVKIAPPKQFDLTAQMPPVVDQGNLGSCVGNATGAVLQFDRRKQQLPDFALSRLMIYLEARRLEGTVGIDAGCEIRDAMKAVAKLGSCDEKLWPYNISKFKQKPPASAYKNALLTQAIDYARVDQDELSLKSVIASGFPVVFGFSVYESFESASVEKTGVVPMPKKTESMLGGHAVVLVGYDANGRFICRNSWGNNWGKAGYFTIPVAYVTNNNLADDFWVIRSVG